MDAYKSTKNSLYYPLWGCMIVTKYACTVADIFVSIMTSINFRICYTMLSDLNYVASATSHNILLS